MAVPVIMPRQGNTVESCVINEIRKHPGDKVEIGDVLFTYETDKASFEEEAKVAGTLLGYFFEEGDDVPCLYNVCVIGNPGERFEQFRPTEDGNPEPAAQAAPAAAAPAAKTAPAKAYKGNAVPVIMPRQGNTVESCVINEFKKHPGDKVEIGDVLFTYETDKASFEEEAKVAGTLLANFFEDGDDVPCLYNVCVIGNPGDDFEQFRPTEDGNPVIEDTAPAAAAAAPATKKVKAYKGNAVPVIMPRQGNTVESCVINEFVKKPGDKVEIGDVLFTYETDKASFEEKAEVAGTLLANFFEDGDDVPCLYNVCVIGNPGDDFEQFRPTEDGNPEIAEFVEVEEEPVCVGKLKISPRAKALADKAHADLSQAVGTGPDGRVIERDVQALIDAGKIIGAAKAEAAPAAKAEAKPAAAAEAPVAAVALGEPVDDSYTEPMTNMRKVIAKAMVTSLSTMAQLTHNLSYDCTEIKAARALYKAKGEAFGMEKISINDIIMYVVARTLTMPEHRAMNANLVDDGKTMKYFRGVHLGMAVDTDRGLMVPTIFNADKMSLKQLSDTAKKLAKECKEGKIKPDYLKGASFTVTNIGSLGIESFTPVVNPPQVGILGVCAMKDAFRVVNGEIKVYPSMNLSLSYDHRAMDGTPASKFLRDLKNNLENFNLILAKG